MEREDKSMGKNGCFQYKRCENSASCGRKRNDLMRKEKGGQEAEKKIVD